MVSDIPIGSPPVPPGRHAAPGGWYPDPVDPAQERYWDGWQWSRNTRPRAGAQQPGFAPPPPQQPYANPYPPAPYQSGYPAPEAVAVGTKASRTADGVPLAGWWWRALAALLDGLFTALVVSALTFPIYRSMVDQFTQLFRELTEAQRTGTTPPNVNNFVSLQDQWIIVAVTLVVGVVYHALFLRWKAATPGKLICGLRVVPVDQGHNRAPLSWNSIAIRVAVWMLPTVNSLLGVVRLIDCLFPLWQPKRQALHDLAAKTQVIRPLSRS